jgi:hypothetical protein
LTSKPYCIQVGLVGLSPREDRQGMPEQRITLMTGVLSCLRCSYLELVTATPGRESSLLGRVFRGLNYYIENQKTGRAEGKKWSKTKKCIILCNVACCLANGVRKKVSTCSIIRVPSMYEATKRRFKREMF